MRPEAQVFNFGDDPVCRDFELRGYRLVESNFHLVHEQNHIDSRFAFLDSQAFILELCD